MGYYRSVYRWVYLIRRFTGSCDWTQDSQPYQELNQTVKMTIWKSRCAILAHLLISVSQNGFLKIKVPFWHSEIIEGSKWTLYFTTKCVNKSTMDLLYIMKHSGGTPHTVRGFFHLSNFCKVGGILPNCLQGGNGTTKKGEHNEHWGFRIIGRAAWRS